MFKNKKIRERIANKRFLKQKYRKAFDIVKTQIDDLDLMGLLKMHCPQDVYEFEVVDIVQCAIKTKDTDTLAENITMVFNEAFNENFNAHRNRILETSKTILNQLRMLNPIEKETYIIPKDLLPGSCYFEFQPRKYNNRNGKTQLDNSIYLYGDDDGNYDYSAIAPFVYLITGSHPNPKAANFFDYCGITYIDENDGQKVVSNIREFAVLLGNGKQIYEALTIMNLYNSRVDESWREEDSVKKLDLAILKNTAEELANWIEKTILKYKWISVLGI